MPRGIPVATVAIGNAENAALLAVEILALGDPDARRAPRALPRRPDADGHGRPIERRRRSERLAMDDPRWEPGMPVLDRQPIGPTGRRTGSPRPQPTPLQKHYINLSAIALVAGAIAITALETGTPLTQPAREALRPRRRADLRRHDRRRGAPLLAQRLGVDADRSRPGAVPARSGSRAALLGIGVAIGVASLILLA